MSEEQNTPVLLLEFLRIEASVRSAQSILDLGFVICNESHRIVPYRQAFFCLCEGAHITLTTISGLVSIDRNTPFYDWFQNLINSTLNRDPGTKPKMVTPDLIDGAIAEAWAEWLPEQLLIIPLLNYQNIPIGFFLLAREEPFMEEEIRTLEGLGAVFAHALNALLPTTPLYRRFVSTFTKRRTAIGLALAIFVCFILPIKQSSLGTAEVTPLVYTSITAPLDGVIAALLVKPNEQVVKGQPLLRLEDTTMRNKLKSAELALDVAKSEAFMTQQKAFVDPQSKGEVATQQARVREKGTTISYMQDLMGKLGVRAPSDGIVLYGDPTDWEGRPVTTGEKIMMLADPQSAGVTVWIPVQDSVRLSVGSSVKLFLSSDPLRSRDAVILRSSYQPVLSPEGIASYRVTAQFLDQKKLPRIGLRGTAKVYGSWTTVGYHILRRPLATIRQKLGL